MTPAFNAKRLVATYGLASALNMVRAITDQEINPQSFSHRMLEILERKTKRLIHRRKAPSKD